MKQSSPSTLDDEMEVEAYRRLFPLQYFERHLAESVRPDARHLHAARPTTIALGPRYPFPLSIALAFSPAGNAVPFLGPTLYAFFFPAGPVDTADGSALIKIGETTMLAAIKLEVMSPSAETPDEGALAVEFNMPPICSPTVRPGRPAGAAPVISKQLSDVIMCSGMINMKEFSLISGKAAWMVYLDIYCLNADGSLFDAALLSAIAALSHLTIPLVSVNDDGRVFTVSEELLKRESKVELVNKEKRKLLLGSIPVSLTCILHKKYILADPTAEEESIMETVITIVLDQSGRLVSFHKPGGAVLPHTKIIKDCIVLTKQRATELLDILNKSTSSMEIYSN